MPDQRHELSEEEQRELAQIRQRKSRLEAKPIGNVVRRLMAQSGYGQTQAVERLQACWRSAVGETLAELSRPGKIARGVLQVHVSDHAAIQELHFQKRMILRELARELPEAKITDLKARVGPLS